MKEADIVVKIHQELKKQLPRAVYLKLNDMSTTGIPDLAITYGDHTLFTEVKLLRAGETASQFKKHFSGLQLATCRLLEQQGRCVYFIAYQGVDETTALILRPHRLAHLLERGANCASDLSDLEAYWLPLPTVIDSLIWRVRQP